MLFSVVFGKLLLYRHKIKVTFAWILIILLTPSVCFASRILFTFWSYLCSLALFLFKSFMNAERSGFGLPIYSMTSEVQDLEPLSQLNKVVDSSSGVSVNVLLPDDLLERILAYLPIPGIFRAGCVCKRWNDIAKSKRFLSNLSGNESQKPWYFMFTCDEAATGHVYDPVFRKWYGGLSLPCIETSNWFVSSSCGLACLMDNDSRSRLYVCNPITKDWKRLNEPSGGKFSDYSALSMTVDRKSRNYIITIVKSKQIPGDFLRWDLSIHVYHSETELWFTSARETVVGWRGDNESVICNGFVYFLVYSTSVRNPESRHRLVMYDVSSRHLQAPLLKSTISIPWPLTCGRLMNLKEKLVMVGGIGKHDRPDIIKGIGIWELNKSEWREVSRMPHRFFQGFGELDDVFASSGIDELIYIQSYGAPALLVFDMNQRQWKWALKCPVSKRFPLQLFTGFCFEPRLDISP